MSITIKEMTVSDNFGSTSTNVNAVKPADDCYRSFYAVADSSFAASSKTINPTLRKVMLTLSAASRNQAILCFPRVGDSVLVLVDEMEGNGICYLHSFLPKKEKPFAPTPKKNIPRFDLNHFRSGLLLQSAAPDQELNANQSLDQGSTDEEEVSSRNGNPPSCLSFAYRTYQEFILEKVLDDSLRGWLESLAYAQNIPEAKLKIIQGEGDEGKKFVAQIELVRTEFFEGTEIVVKEGNSQIKTPKYLTSLNTLITMFKGFFTDTVTDTSYLGAYKPVEMLDKAQEKSKHTESNQKFPCVDLKSQGETSIQSEGNLFLSSEGTLFIRAAHIVLLGKDDVTIQSPKEITACVDRSLLSIEPHKASLSSQFSDEDDKHTWLNASVSVQGSSGVSVSGKNVSLSAVRKVTLNEMLGSTFVLNAGAAAISGVQIKLATSCLIDWMVSEGVSFITTAMKLCNKDNKKARKAAAALKTTNNKLRGHIYCKDSDLYNLITNRDKQRDKYAVWDGYNHEKKKDKDGKEKRENVSKQIGLLRTVIEIVLSIIEESIKLAEGSGKDVDTLKTWMVVLESTICVSAITQYVLALGGLAWKDLCYDGAITISPGKLKLNFADQIAAGTELKKLIGPLGGKEGDVEDLKNEIDALDDIGINNEGVNNNIINNNINNDNNIINEL